MAMSSTSIRRTTAITLLVTVALAGCGGGDASEPVAMAEGQAAPTPVAFGLVSAPTAADLADDDDVVVIDVRTPEEYDAGHVDDAALIDFYADTFADEIAALDRDANYLIYCRSGNRSGQAHELMAELGFENVYDLDGGVIAWAEAGLALDGP